MRGRTSLRLNNHLCEDYLQEITLLICVVRRQLKVGGFQVHSNEEKPMKLRNLLLAAFGLVILAGSALPANASYHHHHHHHHYHHHS